MFGLGFNEVLVVLIIALLVFGPEKLPEVARTVGKTLAQLRNAMDDLKRDISISSHDFNGPLLEDSSAVGEPAKQNEAAVQDSPADPAKPQQPGAEVADLDPVSSRPSKVDDF